MKTTICYLLMFLFFLNENVEAQNTKESSVVISFDTLNKTNLSFLKNRLKNKQIVLIGESSHGIKEFGSVKENVVEFLIDSLNYNVVLFESGFSDMLKWANNGYISSDSSVESLFSIFRTKTNLNLIRFLKGKKIRTFGIDPQNSSSIYSDYPYYQIYRSDTTLAKRFKKIDTTWFNIYHKPISSWDYAVFDIQKQAISEYTFILNKLIELNQNVGIKLDPFLIRILENRISLAKAINKSPDAFHRDSIMNDNVEWIINNLLAKEDKIIIISHNAHISKTQSFNIGYLGELMVKKHGDNLFSIAQYVVSGDCVDNNRNIKKIPVPIKNSFESYLNTYSSKYNVFDPVKIDSNTKKIFHRKIKTYYMGGPIIQELVLSKSYDLIFSVKEVTIPEFIK